MCGIAGFLAGSAFHSGEGASAIAQRMANAIAHRGPDDSGVWVDEGAKVALGHRRLSVIDLSSAGHQPMQSASGRFVIAFNGEIYNHLALRSDVAEYPWRGHSDTETLLACIEQWGLERSIVKAVGMFALALWDRESRRLSLVRDRVGEKPLYYGWQGDSFLFGSELKALKPHPSFVGRVDRRALASLLHRSYILAPDSIYEGIHKLPPGCILEIDERGAHQSPTRYWSVTDSMRSRENSAGIDPSAATSEFESLVAQAVKLQSIADVPLGAFLSGGIDSSAVVAVMQAQSTRPVKTFTIGFSEETHDEARFASRVARHLGTEHTELYVSPSEAMEIIPDLPAIYDEPLGDASQIPTILVSRLARREVTVALSGDGGDELLGGYGHYFQLGKLAARVNRMPKTVRATLARAIQFLPQSALTAVLAPLINLRGRKVTQPPGERLQTLAAALLRDNDFGFFSAMKTHWPHAATIVKGAGADDLNRWPASFPAPPAGQTAVEAMMFSDLLTYLPDDILAKVDRAAMSVSLETRIPLLDHNVVDFVAGLPLDMKIREGKGKWLLRELLRKHVPMELIDRPKMGFSVPLGQWLRQQPVKDWAEDLLAPDRLEREGFFDPAPIRERWSQHLSGRFDWQSSLWTVLMFQSWLEQESPPVGNSGSGATNDVRPLEMTT